MITRRTSVALAATAALGVAAAAGPAFAAKKNQIAAVGGTVFTPGESIADAQQFSPRVLTVKRGATVTLVNRSDDQGSGHTLSLLKKRAVPKSLKDAAPCFEGKGVCGPLVVAHQANPETGEIKVPLVNAGGAGFDTPGDKKTAGDSIYLPSKGKVSFKVTAKKGTTLNYFCAIHPWMNGQIKVAK